MLDGMITCFYDGSIYFTHCIAKDNSIKAEDVGSLDCQMYLLWFETKKNLRQLTK